MEFATDALILNHSSTSGESVTVSLPCTFLGFALSKIFSDMANDFLLTKMTSRVDSTNVGGFAPTGDLFQKRALRFVT